MRFLRALCAAAIVGCQGATSPNATALWVGEVPSKQLVIFLNLRVISGVASGSADVSYLTQTGTERLTVAGQRRADTLDIAFTRTGQAGFRFVGTYATDTRVVGTLDGAEFQKLGIAFIKD